MKNKKGQLNISFGAIFSIIIVVATLSVAGFVIFKFINTTNEIDCNLFYKDLQEEVDKAWQSDGESSYIFSKDVATSTEKVCFGFLNQSLLNQSDKEAYDFFKRVNNFKENLYIYPRDSCGKSNYRFEIKNAVSEGFFCAETKSGKVSLRISKELGEKVFVSKV